MRVRYFVRVVNKDGEVVLTEKFKRRYKAFEFIKAQLDKGRAARIRRKVLADKFSIEPAEKWGRASHDPYSYGPKPVGTGFAHTSVTEQLSDLAIRAKEREGMRKLDAIAFGRGFNGISYSQCIFPSGRAYEGRGWGVVEAATAPYNEESDSICFVGNTDSFKPTKAQLEAFKAVVKDGQRRGFLAKRGLAIRGHREVAPKACPGRYVTDAMLAEIEKAVNA